MSGTLGVDPLHGLKGFQRDTVEYAFSRLWTDPDQVDQFLVADEVGLGKTMVARGVVAKTVDHLAAQQERIKVVYICSNQQIARQNLGRLSSGTDAHFPHAQLLTMLPHTLSELKDRNLSFLSFTPGTSIEFGNAPGRVEERAVLLVLLSRVLGARIRKAHGWRRFFECNASLASLDREVRWHASRPLDQAVCDAYVEQLTTAPSLHGGSLLDEVQACVSRFSHYTRGIPETLHAERIRYVGLLRRVLAELAVDFLEPDLVVLDEFQNFKKILPVAGAEPDESDSAATRLMRKVLTQGRTKVLMLSATPFSMYTLPNGETGDSHQDDFLHTVAVLGGADAARTLRTELKVVRRYFRTGRDFEAASAAQARVQGILRRFMCRTERVSATADGNSMIADRDMGSVHVMPADLRRWQLLDNVCTHIGAPDPLEYWKSAPYALNLMERGSYVMRTKLAEHIDAQDKALGRLLADAPGLINAGALKTYEALDPANGKLRAFVTDTVGQGTWRVAWLPPALPYYQLAGPFAAPEIQRFTKRLVFSALNMVPRAISAVTSYAAEQHAAMRARDIAGDTTAGTQDSTSTWSSRIPYSLTPDQVPRYLQNLLLTTPFPTLAGVGDPLELARTGDGNTPPREAVIHAVEGRIASRLRLTVPRVPAENASREWYVAGAMLVERSAGDTQGLWRAVRDGARLVREDEERRKSRALGEGFVAYVDRARELAAMSVSELVAELGDPPTDLERMLAQVAVASPGVCAARALTRGGGAVDDALASAFQMGEAVRTMMNRRDVYLAIQVRPRQDAWRDVLDHCLDGCLQSVLDEYAHMLTEMEGVREAEPTARFRTLAEAASLAITLRGGRLNYYEMNVKDGVVEEPEPHRLGLHFAVRFGRADQEGSTANYEREVRAAFNSPFRPFVLSTTSVGQEGLDFHAYSHAVVHWNLPPNPVDMEQREGRVHRYKGHAVRKNIAAQYGVQGRSSDGDPWEAMFRHAEAARAPGESELVPHWVFTAQDGAVIERYVPMFAMSRDVSRAHRLRRSVSEYRLLLGQPRQSELVGDMPERASELMIDLSPGRR